MHGPAPHEARTVAPFSLAHRKSLVRSLLVALAVGVFLGVIGPFGSIAAPFHTRMVYWVLLIVVGALIGEIVVPAVLHVLPRRLPYVFAWFFISVIVTLPMLVLVPLASQWLMGWRFNLSGWDGVTFAFYVWIISALMAGIGVFLGRQERLEQERQDALAQAAAEAERAKSAELLAAESLAANSAADPARALRDRLPLRLQHADVYALEAEDHYVRVHTSGGSELVLMRLADAVREAEGLEGLQTHRSWWVARSGVARIARDGEKLTAVLRSGVEVPVSRNFARSVREAGWR